MPTKPNGIPQHAHIKILYIFFHKTPFYWNTDNKSDNSHNAL